ncbi:hypothetical protein [Romboutsia sp. 1001713B170207_170306_H8]|uniref:hypothetical protein n=1 Tax=Romboutsia sp. 1001713B170207_170306_H8 TaxID=2787112 RepID=UPI00082146CE|nr:hypothetical protein [Romboutsia sp. 1001713B170207_170306_H8]SCH85344.1 Uncharacterised protein [uncultured Clostridium sp.]
MIKIKDSDLMIMKRILGDLYLENGNTEEVILLSKAIDKIIPLVNLAKKIETNLLNYMQV